MVGGATEFAVDMQEFISGSITVSIANIGVNPATSVSISIPQQENLRITGAQSVFLGNLNPGDSTIASFNVAPVNYNATSELKVKISYTDTSGLRQSFEENVIIRPTEIQNPQRRGNASITNVTYLIGGIIVIASAYLLVKRKRKPKS